MTTATTPLRIKMMNKSIFENKESFDLIYKHFNPDNIGTYVMAPIGIVYTEIFNRIRSQYLPEMFVHIFAELNQKILEEIEKHDLIMLINK